MADGDTTENFVDTLRQRIGSKDDDQRYVLSKNSHNRDKNNFSTCSDENNAIQAKAETIKDKHKLFYVAVFFCR